MKNNNKKNMNLNEILALIVSYMKVQIEYTEFKLKSYKEWNADECTDEDCLESCCDETTVSISDDTEPSFDEKFREEWS